MKLSFIEYLILLAIAATFVFVIMSIVATKRCHAAGGIQIEYYCIDRGKIEGFLIE